MTEQTIVTAIWSNWDGDVSTMFDLSNDETVFVEDSGIRLVGGAAVSWYEVLAFLESHQLEIKGAINAKSNS
jgi:hypothetical protein